MAQPPLGVLVPRSRQSSSLRSWMRVVPVDGVWHRVGDIMGGTTAEQYARRLNSALRDLPGQEAVWEFGYKPKGDASELWARFTGTRAQAFGVNHG